MSQAILKSRVSGGFSQSVRRPPGTVWGHFALFSAHATKVELCLFDDGRERELERIELPEYSRRGLARLPARRAPGTTYGYRSTATTSRKPGIVSIPKTGSRPLCQGACRQAEVGTPPVSATPWART